MQPQVVELPELTVLGLSKKFQNRNKSAVKKLWENLERGFSSSVMASPARYGINRVTNGDIGEFSYTAGIAGQKNEAPTGLKEVDIPAGQYAVAKTKVGPDTPYQTTEDAVAWLWSDWLPSSDWESREDFEFVRFESEYCFEAQAGEVLLAIPVAKRGTSLAAEFGL